MNGSTRPNQGLRVGVDLGGTKIEAVAMDAAGAIVARQRIEAPARDYARTIGAVADLVDGIAAEDAVRAGGGVGAVGVGTPGAISTKTGLLKNSNSTWLNGRPLDRDLAKALELPLRLDNDANCFARSEAADGAAAGESCVFGVILGTGVGGGLVVNGHTLQGANAICGEWGHVQLSYMNDDERPGPDCYCGRRGCIETWCSGPSLARDYREVSGEPVARVEEVVSRAEQGEWLAKNALARHVDRLARGLSVVMNVVDPDVIVLGGGLSNMPHLYEELPKALEPYVFTDEIATRIVPPKHGDSSGVRGAAWLWSPDEL
ncbi:MAG: ROK family protein [Pseudomonadota bacterium]